MLQKCSQPELANMVIMVIMLHSCAQCFKFETDWCVLSSRYIVRLLLDCCIYCICSWMVLGECVHAMGGGRGEGERERDGGQRGPHCSNISKFADTSSACQAWDSSGSTTSHTYLPHSQTAWHSFCKHTYCETHTHTCSIIQFRRARSHHTTPCRRHVTCTPLLDDSHICHMWGCASIASTQTGRAAPSTTTCACGRGMWSFVIPLTVTTDRCPQEMWLREYPGELQPVQTNV